MKPPGAVVIGGYINGLGVIRSLAARGIPTAVITTERYDIAQHSRRVSIHESVAECSNESDAIAELLEHRAPAWRGWAVIPTIDAGIEALARHRDRLSSDYRLVCAPPAAARCLLNKTSMLEAAKSVGIQTPHCYGPADSMPPASSLDLRFPVIVKPVVAHTFFRQFQCKLFVARDAAELTQCIARVESARIPCSVFDVIPGADDLIYAYCTYVDARGEHAGGLTIRKIRQSPPFFGVTRVAEIVGDIPNLRDATLALLRRIGFHGMAAAEFKLDPRDGTFRFMEVNGRSVLYNGLLRRGGLDLVGVAWSDQACGSFEAPRLNGWRGVWINLHADLLHSTFGRRRDPISLRQFAAPYQRPIEEAVWSASDPRPFIAQWSTTIRRGATAILGGRLQDELAARGAAAVG